jgi:phosphate transport system permease protein
VADVSANGAEVKGQAPGSLPRQRRSMKTARSVIIIDKTADWVIRIGGVGVIVAVFGIMVFLAQVVVPLFTGASLEGTTSSKIEPGPRALMEVIDEYKVVSTSVDATGKVHAFHIPTGTELEVPSFDLGGKEVTAFNRTLNGRDLAFGFSDGTLRLGTLKVGGAVLDNTAVPEGLKRLNDADFTDGKAIYTAISADQMRVVSIGVELGDETQAAPAGTAIAAIDYRLGGTIERPTRSFITVDATGIGRVSRAESRTNMMTGATTTTMTSSELPGLPQNVHVHALLMTDKADQVYVAEESGNIFRYDTRTFTKPELAETVDLLPGDAKIGAIGFLIGQQSLVIGGTDGSVNVYFRLQRPESKTTDGFELVRAHTLEPHTKPVVAMDSSQRGKMFVTADAGGEVWVRHSTSEQVVLKLAAEGAEFDTIALAPRENGVVGITGAGQAHAWDIAVPHPETTLKTIFGKVWYEGYPEPDLTWQSSSGTDAFEPKLSLVPLIFGTIKATIYSLLFAIPIALGAAIYTSEFVHHRVRAIVKPTMELMASLPSVVLGFIAALILAPLVETWIAAIFCAFVVVPTGLFVGAYLWQLLPSTIALRYGGLPKFALIFAALIGAGFIAFALGPWFEAIVFDGDLKAWSTGVSGDSAPFTAMLIFPAVFVVLFMSTSDISCAVRIAHLPA